jgi:beta-lactamase superfamily II metal-dependent hydrolase
VNVTPLDNGSNITPPSNITIIVNPQENQTVEGNYTPPVPQENISKELNYTFEPEANSAIYFIYVGDSANKLHGDAILIRKGDLEILVDAGPVESAGKVVDFLKARGVDDIDVLISTNADPLHYGGIGAVASEFTIEEFWWSGKPFGDSQYADMALSMDGKTKTVRTIGRGFSMSLNGMNITALNPTTKPFGDVDNDAITLRVQDRNFSTVLLSNIEFGAYNEMLNNQKSLLKCNVMQAPHFGLGAGTSGIGNFLQTLKPEVVVISGGPDESAQSGGSREPFRKLMQEYKISYYENYINGTVRVSSDGATYSVGYFN